MSRKGEFTTFLGRSSNFHPATGHIGTFMSAGARLTGSTNDVGPSGLQHAGILRMLAIRRTSANIWIVLCWWTSWMVGHGRGISLRHHQRSQAPGFLDLYDMRECQAIRPSSPGVCHVRKARVTTLPFNEMVSGHAIPEDQHGRRASKWITGMKHNERCQS